MENLKSYRKKLNLSQRQLAYMLHCDRSTVSKWETGVNMPTPELVPQIAQLLDCSINDLFSSKEVKA